MQVSVYEPLQVKLLRHSTNSKILYFDQDLETTHQNRLNQEAGYTAICCFNSEINAWLICKAAVALARVLLLCNSHCYAWQDSCHHHL